MNDGHAVVGVLHPGAMGASIAAAARAAGHDVTWCSAGRSNATRERATQAGLRAIPSLNEFASENTVIISVCPPAAALATAREVINAGFSGLYLDANAVAPITAETIAATIIGGGATYIDGGIIGPPVTAAGTTRLYLSGTHAARIAQLFTTTLLEASVLGDGMSTASALKLSYAAWTKGSAALLLAVAALARKAGVDNALSAEWQRSQPGLSRRLDDAARGNAAKAWRFVAEMEEISTLFAALGLPSDFHRGAAEIYARLENYSEGMELPAILDLLAQETHRE